MSVNRTLYLAEVRYRFNHRDEDLSRLLRKLLQATPSLDIRSILVRFG